jgi:hypothetical protein
LATREWLFDSSIPTRLVMFDLNSSLLFQVLSSTIYSVNFAMLAPNVVKCLNHFFSSILTNQSSKPIHSASKEEALARRGDALEYVAGKRSFTS